MPIPKRIKDETLISKNPDEIYYFCVLLRLLIGILIYFKKISNINIIILCIIIILLFSIKLFRIKKTWKVYIRTILTYMITAGLTIAESDKTNNIAGLLVISDTLAGIQSKYIQSNFTD